MNPSKFIYDQEKMRRHLIECLESQKFSNFPFSINTNWKKKKVMKTSGRAYIATVGDSTIKMMQCVVCETWVHHRCPDERTLKRIERDSIICFK